MSLEIIGVAGITVICYLVAMGVKATALDSKWIPVICGTVGAALGVVAFMTGMPDFPAADVLTAIAVGIVSGLASCGAYDTYAGLVKYKK